MQTARQRWRIEEGNKTRLHNETGNSGLETRSFRLDTGFSGTTAGGYFDAVILTLGTQLTFETLCYVCVFDRWTVSPVLSLCNYLFSKDILFYKLERCTLNKYYNINKQEVHVCASILLLKIHGLSCQEMYIIGTTNNNNHKVFTTEAKRCWFKTHDGMEAPHDLVNELFKSFQCTVSNHVVLTNGLVSTSLPSASGRPQFLVLSWISFLDVGDLAPLSGRLSLFFFLVCSDQCASNCVSRENWWQKPVGDVNDLGWLQRAQTTFFPWPFAQRSKLLDGKTDCKGERQVNCNDAFPASSEVVIWSLDWQRELICLSFLHAVPLRAAATVNLLPPSHPWPALCITSLPILGRHSPPPASACNSSVWATAATFQPLVPDWLVDYLNCWKQLRSEI